MFRAAFLWVDAWMRECVDAIRKLAISNEQLAIQVSLRDDFIKCGAAATALPSSRRGWPVGPGDGLLFVREKFVRISRRAGNVHDNRNQNIVPIVLQTI